MPRPNAKWEEKYGQKDNLSKLTNEDTLLTGCQKLACGNLPAYRLLLDMFRITGASIVRLVEMDDLKIYGNKIIEVASYYNNKYSELMEALENHDLGLCQFVKGLK